MAKSRRLPGKPINWNEFLKMALIGRELRQYDRANPKAGLILRSQIIKQPLIGEGMVYFAMKPGARMNFIGKRGGLWVQTNNVSYVMALGNRPRQLDDGRILLIKRADTIVDILPIGDVLDPGEISSE